MLYRAALYRNSLIAGPVSLPDTDAHSPASPCLFFFVFWFLTTKLILNKRES